MNTTIGRVIVALLACANGIQAGAAINHGRQYDPAHAKIESATEFSLLDDSGEHVLSFGAAIHGRRLASTKKLHLKFKAFGTSHSYHLRPSPSVLSGTTKVYSYNKARADYHIYDAAGDEARSFSSKGVALTFLAHNKITGTVLLHNRYENNKQFDKYSHVGALAFCMNAFR